MAIGRTIMMRRIAFLAVGAVVLLAANADAATHFWFNFGIRVPAPVVVAPAPVYVPPPVPVYAPPPAPVYAPPPPPYASYYGYVWVPAYSVWTGYGYRTVPGAWVRPPFRGAIWVAPHWERNRGYGRESFWVNGYWRH